MWTTHHYTHSMSSFPLWTSGDSKLLHQTKHTSSSYTSHVPWWFHYQRLRGCVFVMEKSAHSLQPPNGEENQVGDCHYPVTTPTKWRKGGSQVNTKGIMYRCIKSNINLHWQKDWVTDYSKHHEISYSIGPKKKPMSSSLKPGDTLQREQQWWLSERLMTKSGYSCVLMTCIDIYEAWLMTLYQ